MGAAKKLLDKKVLRDLVPINALSAAHIDEISRKAVIEDLRSGSYLFKKGDRDGQTVYLLEGQLEFLDGANNVIGSLAAGSEQARHPVAHKQPRQLGARARGKATVARIDSNLLDVLLTWDESAGYDVVEIDTQDDGDWMTRMLQSQAFLQLPPANIHQLLMRLESISASTGDVIVRQGDEGDYFYIVKTGNLVVTRKASPRSKEVLLAELGEGACFGEEALVSGARRNATVMMVTDGTLMRLSKNDFSELLCEPLVHETDYASAQQLVAKGARWLDVRLPGEFENQAISGSFNLPLSALREECAELDKGTDYVVCCDTGRRSAAGAFVLSQRGFTVYTLKNGLIGVPGDALTSRAGEASSDTDRDAEIIPFGSDTRVESAPGDGNSSDEARDGAADAALIDKLAAAEGDKLALQQEIERLETRVAELDCQLEEHAAASDEANEALKQELTEARAELLASSRQQESAQQQRDRQLAELEQELVRLREDYQQLGQRTSAVAGERDAANRDLQEAREQLKTLQEQLGGGEAQGHEELAHAQQVLAEQKQTIEAKEAGIRDLQHKLEEAENTRRQLEQQRSDAEGETQNLNLQIEELRQRLEQTGTELGAERDRLAERAERLQQEVQDLQGGRELLEQACTLANAEKDELATRLTGLRQNLEEQQQLAQDRQSEYERLRQQLEDVQRQLEEKSAREQALQVELQTLGRQDEARSSQSQQQLDEATRRVTALEAELAESRQRQQEAERRNSDVETRIAALIKDHKSELDGSRNALTRAQTETENVKREHSRVMESLRKAELNLERERQDHEGELYRLRRELKEAAGESSAGLAAEMEAMQVSLQESLRARDDLEIKLGERSAQLEDVQAEADRLILQLQQARDSARQAEQQLLDSNHAANEEMSVRIEAEEKARQTLREELSSAVSARNQAQERLTVQLQELEELRQAVEALRQQADGREQSQQELVVSLRQERDAAREQLRHGERERDAVLEREREVRKELDKLRAEAEVTRGLVDMQASGAGDSVLREQLDQAKKNVDVAVRLRAQAEEKYAQLEIEIERLRSRLQSADSDASPARRIPSLDDSDPHAAVEMNPVYDADPGEDSAGSAPQQVYRDTSRPVRTALLDEPDQVVPGRGFGRLLAGVVLGAVVAGAGTWWLLTQSSLLPDGLRPPVSEDPGRTVSAGSTEKVPTADEKTIAAGKQAEPSTVPAKSEPSKLTGSGASDRDAAVPPVLSTRDKGVSSAVPSQSSMRIPDFIKGGSAVADRDRNPASRVEESADQALAVPVEPSVQAAAPEPLPAARKAQPLRLYSEAMNDGGRAPVLVEFQADSFEMGSGASSANFDERPRHRVALRRFSIGAHEVTFADYDRFARATGRRFPSDNGWGRGERPVINVSWQDAVAYTRWLSEQTGSRYRLPSEAEWEFAAQSGSDSRFWWGNEVVSGLANCFDCGTEWSGRMTAPTGSFPASAYRVHDMAGNVMEWVEDCYQPDYSSAPGDGRAVSSGDCGRHMVRGGAYNSPSESLRTASRDARETGTRLDNLGFRVVKE